MRLRRTPIFCSIAPTPPLLVLCHCFTISSIWYRAAGKAVQVPAACVFGSVGGGDRVASARTMQKQRMKSTLKLLLEASGLRGHAIRHQLRPLRA